MESNQDYRITGRKGLDSLEGTLEKWIALNNVYCSKILNDAPYIYTEEANLSILCAAAWQSENVCLLEFQHKKHSLENHDPKVELKNGRCDLFISNHHIDYFCEAKNNFLILKKGSSIDKAEKFQKKAIYDAKRTIHFESSNEEEKMEGLAVNFIAPIILERNKEKMRDYINALIKGLIDKKLFHALAWVFPNPCENLTLESKTRNGSLRKYIYPGIIIGLNNIKYV